MFKGDLWVIEFYVLMGGCMFMLRRLIVDVVEVVIEGGICRKEGGEG